MSSLKKVTQKGFTIVELLIVIVVIGILAALVITTYNGIQQKGRNTERTTDLKAIQGQLEAYYAQNGVYPAESQLGTTAQPTYPSSEPA
jgi:type II secretion system protein G